ncbi:replicative DNA helicase [Nonlabens spongiae]|uniref:Replicative DNA helicase n=1 Tax=Nonlabens spongiae TaxID=331648 RepID=A0A1W6MJ25_9FLAO|nr:replicative DNA helicase [Nonlabens spongiae]ARN77624.1 replicative DNA helicase [Nonlabens spongiae]
MENVKELTQSYSKNTSVVTLEKGKVPPQALDLEKVVLGALMIDGKGVDEVIDLLTPEAFYHKAHQSIFESIDTLFKSGSPVDLLTVSAQLRKDKKLDAIGGDHYLVQLSQLVSSTAHIEFHARIILQKFIQRSLIKISTEIINDSYDEATDVFDLLDKAESKLYEVTQGNIRKSTETAMDLVRQAKERIEEIANRDGLSGIPTGFTDLDRLTSGWQPSDLIIIAARPGMGKTAFTLSMARNIAVGSNTPVAFFSLEMSSVQLITRLISSETGLSSEKLRTGKLEPFEWEQLNVKVKDLEQAPIFIDDTPSLSIFDLRAKCRRLASQYGIKLIMIDYLQLMTANTGNKNGNREQEISTISRNLKALAKELDVPVIALSQLSRAVESRGGSKRPLLSDLRESGAIEQDADIVSFIYRPEYYNMEEWDDDDRSPTKDQAEFIVAKHRNGATDAIRLKFLGQFGKFDNLDDYFQPDEFGSKMNAANDDTNKPDPFGAGKTASPGDAFGIPDDDMPF